MIYKNDPKKLKQFLRKIKIKIFCNFAIGMFLCFVFFTLFCFDINFYTDESKYKIFIWILIWIVLEVLFVFLSIRFQKKNYLNYSFEILEDFFIVTDTFSSVKNYGFNEIKKIKQLKNNQLIIYFNNYKPIITSVFLENYQSFYEEISKIHQIENV